MNNANAVGGLSSDVEVVTLLELYFNTRKRRVDVDAGFKGNRPARGVLDNYFNKGKLILCERGIKDFQLSTVDCLVFGIDFMEVNKLKDVLKVLYGQGCRVINEIDLSWAYKMKDEDLMDAVKAYSDIFRSLRRINLNNCSGLTDVCIEFLLKKCPNLTIFNFLFNYPGNVNVGLKSLGECRNIKEVNLAGCCKLTDDSLKFILEGCPDLAELDLSRCMEITDASLKILGKCSKLVSLDIGRCSKITDIGLKSLEESKSLASLNLWYCYGVTREGVRSLRKKLKECYLSSHFELIYLSGVKLIGE